jgi:dienelactone hydrolase
LYQGPLERRRDFDCYLNVPDIGRQVPAAVLASAVHGVDDDIIAIADELAGLGLIAAAPDLFWRTLPGPLSHDDRRAQERSQPRLDKIRQGEADMVDTLARLGRCPNSTAVPWQWASATEAPMRSSGRNALATLLAAERAPEHARRTG